MVEGNSKKNKHNMVNRSLLRIKALQVLYSSGINNNDINSTKIEIQHSIKQAYNLYHYLLLLISDTTNFVELEDDRFKNRIQQEESFDHTRFMKNRFACQMVQNVDLYSYIKDNQLDQYFWDKKFINKLFYTTITSPFYEEYLSNNDSYENDKWIWRKIFEKILLLINNYKSGLISSEDATSRIKALLKSNKELIDSYENIFQ